MAPFRIKIDQLPEEEIEAADPRDAARQVGSLIERHESLRKLADEEPVQIKRPDGTPWGRNLTLGDFRAGLAHELGELDEANDAIVTGEGPLRPAKP